MTSKHSRSRSTARFAPIFLTAAFAAVAPLCAQQYQFPGASGGQLHLPSMPTETAITPNGKVVEDVIARINDQIITRSDYYRSEQQIIQDAQQAHAPQSDVDDRIHNLLRDMIDQQLLLSKAKELGLNCDADVTRQLDDIRKEQHLESMEALEKAAAEQGVSFEDFKQNIRNQCLTRKVVQEDVGRHVSMTHADEQAYYEAHKAEFTQPEQIHLSEILIPTPDNATDAQVAEAQQKADAVEGKLKGGANFAEVAKSDSGGPSAAAGGELGDFKRGTLGDVLENATFSLKAGQFTQPIRTRQGYVILRVDSHQAAGVPPLDQIEPQVQEGLYMQGLQPVLRNYLTKARDEAYVEIKAGFVDSGAAHQNSNLGFTAYQAPAPKKKIVKRQEAEQERAQKAAEALAAEREKVAEKQAQKAASNAEKAGVKNVNYTKPKKVRKEKVRYGQAPRNSLPRGGTGAMTAAPAEGAPIAGQAPGVAMAPTQSVTTITTGTGPQEANNDADPLAPKVEEGKKVRFATREDQYQEKTDKAKLNKAATKANMRSITPTAQQTADEKVQATPLGLNGDTVKKQKKKKDKDAPKERLQSTPPKPAPQPDQPVAPTVNPALGPGAPPPAATPAPTNQSAPTTPK